MRLTVRMPDGRPVDLVGSPFHIDGQAMPAPAPPPQLGQHTEEVLRDVLGLEEGKVEELRGQGVIG